MGNSLFRYTGCSGEGYIPPYPRKRIPKSNPQHAFITDHDHRDPKKDAALVCLWCGRGGGIGVAIKSQRQPRLAQRAAPFSNR